MEYVKVRNKHGVVNTVTRSKADELLKSGEGYAEIKTRNTKGKQKDLENKED